MTTQRATALRQRTAGIQATYGSYRSTDLNRARLINRDGSGDRHADDYSRRLARELARDQDRSSGIYRAIVTAFLDMSIGQGVWPLALTADPDWNKLAADLFAEEATQKNGFDIEGVDNYPSLQRKWGRAIVNDGDLLLVKLQGGKIATIEADRVDGRPPTAMNQYRRCQGGVILDTRTGERLSYGVSPYDQTGTTIQLDRAKWYDPSEVIYAGTASRKSQVRSLPALVANLDDAERADSLIESEIIGAEQASMIWGWIKDATGNAAGGGANALAPVNSDGSTALGGNPTTGNIGWQDWVAGTLGFLGNREFQQAQTTKPNLNVVEFLKALIRIFAAELGVPMELALLDVGAMSWSGNKALLAFCERRLDVWRQQTFGPLFSSIYRWRIGTYMQRGDLAPRSDWWKHTHTWPRPPEVDGPDQVTTDRGNLAMGRTSLRRIVGPDWSTILDERATEIRHAIKLASDINGESAEAGVTWRDLTSTAVAPATPPQQAKPLPASKSDGNATVA